MSVGTGVLANRWITLWPEPQDREGKAATGLARLILDRPRLSGAILLAAGAVCCWGAVRIVLG